jgi:hypothetical protein
VHKHKVAAVDAHCDVPTVKKMCTKVAHGFYGVWHAGAWSTCVNNRMTRVALCKCTAVFGCMCQQHLQPVMSAFCVHTDAPTGAPTTVPTPAPTATNSPTSSPTVAPTSSPTSSPTRDCVMGDWSHYTLCPQTCNPDGAPKKTDIR